MHPNGRLPYLRSPRPRRQKRKSRPVMAGLSFEFGGRRTAAARGSTAPGTFAARPGDAQSSSSKLLNQRAFVDVGRFWDGATAGCGAGKPSAGAPGPRPPCRPSVLSSLAQAVSMRMRLPFEGWTPEDRQPEAKSRIKQLEHCDFPSSAMSSSESPADEKSADDGRCDGEFAGLCRG